MSFLPLISRSSPISSNFKSLIRCHHHISCESYRMITGHQQNIVIRSTFRVTTVSRHDISIIKRSFSSSDEGKGLPKPEGSKARGILHPTFSWRTFRISAVILSIFFGLGLYYKREKDLIRQRDRRRSLGKAAIGGSFELIDHNGNPFSSKDLLGKWYIIYFGFSHCPDICPEEMEKMVEVVKRCEKMGTLPPVLPVFISVDPERDTPQVVSKYVKEFSPKIIGLTGSKEQVDKATKCYRVYYSAGPRDGENDYIVDHSIIMYLVNPEGEFVDYYGQVKTAEQITNGVALNIAKYEALKKRKWL